jgi:dipeptidase D
MTDQSIEHGPVTILLTVDEEKGMSGAKALDPNLLPETGILLNLDSEEGPEEICIGCAGSADTVASFPIGDREALPEGYTSMELDIKGFPGGHSGIAIHAGRGNAIKAIGDLLSRLQNIAGDLRIIEIKGGEKRNAIPSSAHATIAVPGNSVEGLNKVVEEFVAELKKGKEVPDPEVTGDLLEKNAGKVEATLVPTESVKLVGALSADFRDRLLNVIAGTPTGPFQSAELPHVGKLVTLSNNLGKVGTTDDSVEVTSMTRGAHVEELRAKLSEVREVYTSKGAILTEAEEPTSGWVEDPGSRAVSMFAKAVEAATGKSKYMAYHAGLEAGILTEKAKELSAVATGPRIRDAHNVTERTELDSIAKQLDALRSLFKETLNEAAAVG